MLSMCLQFSELTSYGIQVTDRDLTQAERMSTVSWWCGCCLCLRHFSCCLGIWQTRKFAVQDLVKCSDSPRVSSSGSAFVENRLQPLLLRKHGSLQGYLSLLPRVAGVFVLLSVLQLGSSWRLDCDVRVARSSLSRLVVVVHCWVCLCAYRLGTVDCTRHKIINIEMTKSRIICHVVLNDFFYYPHMDTTHKDVCWFLLLAFLLAPFVSNRCKQTALSSTFYFSLRANLYCSQIWNSKDGIFILVLIFVLTVTSSLL